MYNIPVFDGYMKKNRENSRKSKNIVFCLENKLKGIKKYRILLYCR